VDAKDEADSINPMDYTNAFAQCASVDAAESTSKSERRFKTLVLVVCGWALIEAPMELGGSISSTALLAVVVSKVLIGLIGTAAFANLRFARQVFTFICGVSVFAIAPALPLEYTRSVAIALMSTVECVVKAVCVASFAIAPFVSVGASARRSLRNRT
jgi:hypothetical protein